MNLDISPDELTIECGQYISVLIPYEGKIIKGRFKLVPVEVDDV